MPPEMIGVIAASSCGAPAGQVRQAGASSALRATRASDHLDMIRGLAAIAVLYGHARFLLIPSPSGRNESILTKVLYVLSGYGHSAVMVFFVLSGYLISRGIIRDDHAARWSWRSYLLARCTRLYLVLIPALLLTLAWDRIGLHIVGNSPGHGDPAHAIIEPDQIRASDGPITLLGNLAFLQTIVVPCFGSNMPLWSLANEFWYYLIFPCCWLACRGRLRAWQRIAYGCLATLILKSVGWGIDVYFLIWLMGTALALAPPPRSPIPWVGKAATLTCLVSLLGLVGLGKIRGGAGVDFMVAFAFAVFLYTVLHDPFPAGHDVYARVARTLSGCSYSSYLTHVPFLIFLRAVFTYQRPWNADLLHWLLFGLVCLTTLGYAYLISRITEAHTDRVRRSLAGWLMPSAKLAAN